MEFSWAVPSITGPQADGGGRNIRSNCHASAAGHNGKRAFQKLERMTVFRALQLTLNQRVAGSSPAAPNLKSKTYEISQGK